MVRIAFVMVVVSLMSACTGRKSITLLPPRTPEAINTWTKVVADALADNKLLTQPTTDKDKRDQAIAYSEAAIMSRYVYIRETFMRSRAWTSIAFETLELGATTTVPIVNGTRGKTILGALATGLTGEQKTLDRNLFNEKTTPAILNAMDACLSRQQRYVSSRRALPVDQYSVYDAYRDLVSEFSCTTLSGALQELDQTQGAAARNEKAVVQTVTPQERDDFENVQRNFLASLATQDRKDAIAFLAAMGAQNITAASPETDILNEYRKLLVPALTDNKVRQKFFDEARKAGLLTKQQ